MKKSLFDIFATVNASLFETRMTREEALNLSLQVMKKATGNSAIYFKDFHERQTKNIEELLEAQLFLNEEIMPILKVASDNGEKILNEEMISRFRLLIQKKGINSFMLALQGALVAEKFEAKTEEEAEEIDKAIRATNGFYGE